MPTENERKYVLNLECEQEFEETAHSILICKQAYLAFSKGMSARVRETIDQSGKSKYKFCFKQKANGRVVEIEKKIDQRDFEDLWSCSMNRLEKLRYNVYYGKDFWEIDFFKNNGESYFALAEFEMPEGQLDPESIPAPVENNLLYVPQIDDSNFSSKRLADVKYAVRKYKELLMNK
jgi:CYTH domain-containing protein